MRYLVLSDIHGNLDALEAVLQQADRAGYDRVLVLGDLVGYGARPNEVIDRIRALHPAAIIRGNHDKVASGVEEPDGFNPIAQEAAEWTHRALTPENRAFLAACPAGPVFVDAETEICHGSPDDEDAYVSSELAALRALKQSERHVCFYGHTHIPVAFRMTETGFDFLTAPDDQASAAIGEGAPVQWPLEIEKPTRYLINPGSVGQPRDGDPRAAFATFDREAAVVVFHRTPYAVDRAQQKIIDAGLPETLARRLALGR